MNSLFSSPLPRREFPRTFAARSLFVTLSAILYCIARYRSRRFSFGGLGATDQTGTKFRKSFHSEKVMISLRYARVWIRFYYQTALSFSFTVSFSSAFPREFSRFLDGKPRVTVTRKTTARVVFGGYARRGGVRSRTRFAAISYLNNACSYQT